MIEMRNIYLYIISAVFKETVGAALVFNYGTYMFTSKNISDIHHIISMHALIHV